MAKEPEKTEPEKTEPEVKHLTADEANAMFTAREKRLTSTMQKMLADALAPIAEKLAPKEEPKATEGEPEWKQKLSEMEKRVQAAEKRAAEEATARDGERKARMRDEERSTLADALREAGVSEPARLKGAMALLFTEEGRVKRDESGNIKFRVQKEGYEDLEDVKKAVKDWTASDEGKAYLPPRAASGSGAAAPKGKPANPNGKKSREEMNADLFAAIFNRND
jgi:hypothetical protein